MITTHADYDHGALCGTDTPDSSGHVYTTLAGDDVDCADCLAALGGAA